MQTLIQTQLKDKIIRIRGLPHYSIDRVLKHYFREYNVKSILFWREGVDFLKEILNPYDEEGIFKGDHWLDAKEIYSIFLNQIKTFKSTENNFNFIFFRSTSLG